MTQPFVREDVKAFLEAWKAMARPPMNDEMIAMMRQLPAGAIPSMDLPLGELGEDRRVIMPGPAGEIALRLFDVRAARGPSPVVVFYHGGGFVAGGIDSHEALAAELSRGLDLPVVSVEYRLAPEHKWPAAPEDAEAAARWIAANPNAFGRTFTGLVLCGDSAGGNLTVVTAMALRDRPAALPVMLQFPFYPLTDSVEVRPSRRDFAEGFLLVEEDMRYFERAYGHDKEHWQASPGRADLAGMPPAVVVTASLDPLRDDGREYARKLEAAGVPVHFYEAEGNIHGFATFRLNIPSAREDLAQALERANGMLAAVLASA